MLVVVVARDRTTTAQGHVEGSVEWVGVSVGEGATGLVPGFAYPPSSTIERSERWVVVLKERTGLSIDEDAVEGEADVGSTRKGGGDARLSAEVVKRLLTA